MDNVKDAFSQLEKVKYLLGEKVKSVANGQYFFNDELDQDDMGDMEITFMSGL